MTNIAHNVAAKATVAFVAAAMIFMTFAPAARAQAQSVEDLQKMIDQLMAQVAALKGGSTGSSAGVCPFTWTRDLRSGATGADVKALQQFLNANADTRVAATGAGSAGMETEYFGPATAAAVSKFQVMHRADVLTPGGLVNPTGTFGPMTRAKANSLCVASTVDDSDDEDMTDDEDMNDDEDSTSLSGEASLDVFDIDAADDDSVEEGDEDAPIAELTVEFTDGDAEISRLDVQLTSAANSGDETDPWDTFETVSLWVDGDMVAEADASSKSDYLGDEDDGIIRFSNLKLVANEDEEMTIVIAATMQNSIDGTSNGNDWTIGADSIRFFDADGVASTETSGFDAFTSTETFTIEEAGFEDEVRVKTSSSDPDGTTLKLEDDKKSDWYTVFVFDLDTDDSINDIILNGVDVQVEFASSGAAYNTFVDDAELVIDGTTIDSTGSDVTAGTTSVATIAFDVDGDVEINAGDRVQAELRLRFKSLSNAANEGVTIRGKITGDDTTIDAEGAEDITGSSISGAATGEYHTLRTTGVEVELDSTDSDVVTSDGALNDYATYTIVLDVTAFDQEVFIPISAASTSWKLVDGNGADMTVPTASTTAVLTSTADEGGAGDAFYEVNEGSTETFTLKVTYSPSMANVSARLQLVSLTFDETGTVTSTDDATWTATPASTYRTAVETIVN